LSEEKSHMAQQDAKKSPKLPINGAKEHILGPKSDPKIHQKAARSGKSVPPEAPRRLMDEFCIDLGGDHRFSQISHRFQVDFS